MATALSTPTALFEAGHLSYDSPSSQSKFRFGSSLEAHVSPISFALETAAASTISEVIDRNLCPTPLIPTDSYDERRFGRSLFSNIFRPAPELPSRDAVKLYFLNACRRAHFQVASVVSVVVLFERIAKQVPVHSCNWRIILLLTILIAQKVIDDISLGTNQMPELFRAACQDSASTFSLRTKDIIRLELNLLATSKYDVAIDSDAWDRCFLALQSKMSIGL